ncbi:hypothetical protein R3P38DRAFT_3029685 [Favolaschia claudopus]|uniref:Transmembrane protein n=1 Tax=Favolaschia claudopus TaxID=2862362 RepID=A0AAW0ADN6_9AGAR
MTLQASRRDLSTSSSVESNASRASTSLHHTYLPPFIETHFHRSPQRPIGPAIFPEADWNDQAVKEVEEKGREASNAAKYRASRRLWSAVCLLVVFIPFQLFTICLSISGSGLLVYYSRYKA